MRIGIIGAMEEEVALLKEKISHEKTLSHAGREIYCGKLQGVDILLIQSGIGKVAAALSTTLLIERGQPDYIINTGSAGSLQSKLSIGDIVVSTAVGYHDVDLRAFGYQSGQMAGCPTTFAADTQLQHIAARCIKKLNLNAQHGLICSGDAFINGAEKLDIIRATFPNAVAVDMEAAAIGHVCHQYALPFVVTRAISDNADQSSHLSFEQFILLASQQSSAMVEAMLAEIHAETAP